MTREEADALAEQLNREAEDRAEIKRVVREGADGWEVVKLRLPPELRRGTLKDTIEG